MQTATFIKPGRIELREYPKAEIVKPTDAVIRVLRACVCGSDLWWYRGIDKRRADTPVGHEAIGIVEAVGSAVSRVKAGDFVIAPFTHGCGHCAACKAGFDGDCLNANPDDKQAVGYQGQYLRFKNADWALVTIPGQPADYTDQQLNDLLTLSDVMATGYHAAITAEVKAGDTVVVFGDGAVGLCGVIAAKMLGASRIIAMSRHEDRQELAREFGATDVIASRGEEAVKDVMAATGSGADAVLECVGSKQSLDTAVKVGRPGAIVGRVGVPQGETSSTEIFWKNIGLRGGTAAVTTYDKEVLLDAVLQGQIHPGHVFTKRFSLDNIQQAYEAMDRREAIKSLVVVSES